MRISSPNSIKATRVSAGNSVISALSRGPGGLGWPLESFQTKPRNPKLSYSPWGLAGEPRINEKGAQGSPSRVQQLQSYGITSPGPSCAPQISPMSEHTMVSSVPALARTSPFMSEAVSLISNKVPRENEQGSRADQEARKPIANIWTEELERSWRKSSSQVNHSSLPVPPQS